MAGNGAGTLFNVDSHRDVELTVHDKLRNEVRIFRCDRHLLERTMSYFKPAIRLYEEEEERALEEKERKLRGGFNNGKEGDAITSTTTTTGVNNNNNNNNNSSSSNNNGGNCYVHVGNNVINNGKDTEESGGLYLRFRHCGPLPPIPLRVNCDMEIFSWLMAHVEGKRRPLTPDIAVSIALSSNFLLMPELVYLSLQYIKDNFLQVLLSGVSMECLTGELLARLSGMLSEGDIAEAFLKLYQYSGDEHVSNKRFLTALLRHMACDRLRQRQASGLSWCRYCGVLFDQQELRRFWQKKENIKPLLCPRLAANSIGARGEVLTTHVASKHPVDLVFPSLSWSDKDVERWAWRVIGAAYIFLCRYCRHLVSLIDTVTHKCHEGPPSFSSPDKNNLADANALFALYNALNTHYERGLVPIYSDKTEVPRETVLTLSTAGEWICEDGSEPSVPGLWSSHPVALEKSVDSRGEVNLDLQNGFERWFQLELLEMMEGFCDLEQFSSTQEGDANLSYVSHQPPLPSSSSLQQQQQQQERKQLLSKGVIPSQQCTRIASGGYGQGCGLGLAVTSSGFSRRTKKGGEGRFGHVNLDDEAPKLRNSRKSKVPRVTAANDCKGNLPASKKSAAVCGGAVSSKKNIGTKPAQMSKMFLRSQTQRGSPVGRNRVLNMHEQ